MRKLLTTQVEQQALRCPTNVLNAAKDSVHLRNTPGISMASMGPRKSVVTDCHKMISSTG